MKSKNVYGSTTILKKVMIALCLIGCNYQLYAQKDALKKLIAFEVDTSKIEASYQSNRTHFVQVRVKYPDKKTFSNCSFSIRAKGGDASFGNDFKFEHGDSSVIDHKITYEPVISIPVTIIHDSKDKNESNETIELVLTPKDTNTVVDTLHNLHTIHIISTYNNDELSIVRLKNKQSSDSLEKQRIALSEKVIGNWLTTGVSIDPTASKLTSPVDLFFSVNISTPTDGKGGSFGMGLQIKAATYATKESSPNFYDGSKKMGYISQEGADAFPIDSYKKFIDTNKTLSLGTGNTSYLFSTRSYSLRPSIYWQITDSPHESPYNRITLGFVGEINYWVTRRGPFSVSQSDNIITGADSIIITRNISAKDTTLTLASRIELCIGAVVGLDYRCPGLADVKTTIAFNYVHFLRSSKFTNSNLQTLTLTKNNAQNGYLVRLVEHGAITETNDFAVVDVSTILSFPFYGGVQLGLDFRFYTAKTENIEGSIAYCGFSLSKNIDMIKLYESIFGK